MQIMQCGAVFLIALYDVYFSHMHNPRCSPYHAMASQGQGIWTLTRLPSRSTTIGACAMAACLCCVAVWVADVKESKSVAGRWH